MPEKVKKKRPVKVQLIPRNDPLTGQETEPYRFLRKWVARVHDGLAECRIALLWNYGWTPDADGRITLGKASKASDKDRELMACDAKIELNVHAWESFDFKDADKDLLIDHELCHLRLVLDNEGDPVKDQRDRLCYRMRKHDVEEFEEIAVRHGRNHRSLESFAKALLGGGRPG